MQETVNAFGRLLRRAAGIWPHREAVVFPDHSESFGGLHARAMLRARQLLALGVQPGEHVGVLLGTSPEFLEVMFGIAYAGAVVVPINARYRGDEIAYLAGNADLVSIVTTGQVTEGLNFVQRLLEGLPGIARCLDARALALEDTPRLRNVLVLGAGAVAAMTSEPDIAAAAAQVDESAILSRIDAVGDDDTALILYTSGTTSRPKGCLLSGRAIIGNGRSLAQSYRMSAEDRFWSPLPMFHIAATLPICACLDVGAAYVTLGYFDAGVALRQLHAGGVTVAYPCFVTIISDLLDHPDFAATDLRAVRVMNSNLAMQPPGFAARLKQAMPDCVQVGTYGMSEACGTVSTSPLDSPEALRISRLGSPMPGQEVRIVDPETGLELPAGQHGEVVVRGPNLMKGYYRDPEKTAQTLRDGWLHTGDVGSLDEHGTIMFHSRLKDMMKVGGENVAAAEIESLLQQHPGVKLAQVVGVADPRLVEVPAAFIERVPGIDSTEEELIGFCRGKIASFKVPRHVRFVTVWPMSTSKIQKFSLRKSLEAELAAAAGPAA